MTANDELEVADAAMVEAGHLRRALESRTTIAAAVGMLMERYGLSYDAAFAHLARLSQDGNVKLRDLAAQIVHQRDERAT